MAVSNTDLITLQIEVGLAANKTEKSVISRPIAASDIATGLLHFGHLRGRVLSVAAAKFSTQLAQVLSERYQSV